MAKNSSKNRIASRKTDLLETSHIQSELKKKALMGAGFTVFAQTTNYGIQTIGTIIIARILSPEDFGLVSMVAVFSLFLQNFGYNGFIEAVIQKEKLTHDQMSKLFWANLLIMSGLTIFFVVLSPVIAWFYGEPQLRSISTGMALSIIFSGMGTCHMALLIRSMKFHLSGLADILAALISTSVGILAALNGVGFWSLVLRRVSLPLVTAVFVWCFCRWKPGVPVKGTVIKPILAFGLKTYGNFLLSYFRHNLDKVLVGKVFGKVTVGHYERAGQLSSLLPNQLTNALSGVGISTLSRLTNEPSKYRSYFSKAVAVLAFIGFPGSVFLTLLGKDIILLLLGNQWSIAGEIFMGLGPGIGVFVIYNTNVWLHISLGRPDRLLKWSLIALGASVLFYSLGLLFGPLGVAIAYSVMFYILLIPSLWYAGRPAGIKASFYFSILWKYWTAAFVSGSICWLTFEYFGPISAFYESSSSLGRIGLGLVLYPLLYLAFTAIMFKGLKPIVMIISLIKDMLRR